MSDLIERQAAIDAIERNAYRHTYIEQIVDIINNLPPAQPTLYGYKIEHLAYIARVMQKEGVTAEYAVRTFDDMSRALRMVIEEINERLEKTLSAMPWMSGTKMEGEG